MEDVFTCWEVHFTLLSRSLSLGNLEEQGYLNKLDMNFKEGLGHKGFWCTYETDH